MCKASRSMQNQAAVEALYSATFVEDYLDCVENLPNDLQRHLSRLREFDLTQYTEFLKDLGSLVSAFEKETTASGQRAILAKIQHGLIAAQDIGDDKLATVQVGICNSKRFNVSWPCLFLWIKRNLKAFSKFGTCPCEKWGNGNSSWDFQWKTRILF